MERKIKLDERIILLVHYLNKVYGRTFMQKFFFLEKMDLTKEAIPRYTKYHYGPFSMDVVNEINILVISKLLKENMKNFKGHEGHYYELTEQGELKAEEIIKKSPQDELKEFEKFCLKYKGYKPSELLKLVYVKYPDWTVKSKLVN